MNKIILYFLLILFINCNSGQKENIKRISISFTDWDMESPINVECNDFKEYFKPVIDSMIIVDPKICDDFETKYNTLNFDNNISRLSNVRIVIEIIYSNNETSSLCIGNNDIISIKNENYTADSLFIKYIKDLVFKP